MGYDEITMQAPSLNDVATSASSYLIHPVEWPIRYKYTSR